MKRLYPVLFGVVALLPTACRATAPEPMVGTYHLLTVNGATLPVRIGPGSGAEFTGGSLLLEAGHRYALVRRSFTASLDRTYIDTVSGTWTADGNTVALYFSTTPAITATATYVGPGLVVNYGGTLYGFERD